MTMTTKNQNSALADLKNEFAETLSALDFIIGDTIVIMLGEGVEPTDEQIDSTIEFLYSELALSDSILKGYRAKMATTTKKVSIPVPKGKGKTERVPTKSVSTKKIVKKAVKKSK